MQRTKALAVGARLLAPVVAASLLPGVVACRGAASERDSTKPAAEETEVAIAWYDGDVEAAFAHARSLGKPVFLYWGAEWCPPCHYLKNKIFTQPAFIERMRDFVPVYLDGDTERAQIVGEELGVKGYPTVIIFDPLGREVMRMPSTVPVDEYTAVLETALAASKPVTVILREVLERGPAATAPADLRLLAYYSWDQDRRMELSGEQQLQAFSRLYRETPAQLSLERSRFLGQYLIALSRERAAARDANRQLSAVEKDELIAEVRRILDDHELRNANLLWIEYYASSIIDLLQPAGSPGRRDLLASWRDAAVGLEEDTVLSAVDRLNGTRLRLALEEMASEAADEDGYTVPKELQDHVRQQAAWVMETVIDESELQAVVNTLAYLLEDADLTAEAEAMLLARLNDTAAPYYYMSWVAGLREEGGDAAGALEWHRKAYDAAQGRYSRFRWGSTYLRKLMQLSPAGSEKIEADSIEVLGELLGHDDAFAGSNQDRLAMLESAYRQWNETGDHEDELARIRDFVQRSCERYPADGPDSQQARCRSFLAPAAAAI